MPEPHSQHPSLDLSLVDELGRLFQSGPVAVLTGAGVSTDSGLPDYRGRGTPPRRPMNIEQFESGAHYRKRFWAGARVGFERHHRVSPNQGHFALATLESLGLTTGVITQNVDDLHRRAGSSRLSELHGNGSRIRCVRCRFRTSRARALESFDELNPGYFERHRDAELSADGDAIVTDIESVTEPLCPECGGALRADVVYFGETVDPAVFTEAAEQVADASALLCVGTSLAVNTGIRLVHRAQRREIPLAVINRGPTAIDHRAAVRIEGGASEALEALLQRLS